MIHRNTRSFCQLLADSDVIAQQRHNPGLLFLTHTLSVLHINQEAHHMIRRFRAAHNGKGPNGNSLSVFLPREILVFAKDLQTFFQAQIAPQDWDHLQLQRVIAPKHRPLLIRGFVLPSNSPTRKGYFLILLEPIILQRESFSHSLSLSQSERFTPRECSLLRFLGRGHSNRDIAHKLGISIHTVKERMKILMLKTQTTTRTGLLAHLLTTNGSSPHTENNKNLSPD